MGAAVARRAACELEMGAGIPSTSVHQLLSPVFQRGMPRGAVVVVDEAGMLGSRQMLEIAERVRKAQGKLVLVGDHRQLPELEAGGAFRTLARRPEAIRLEENRRQVEAWERVAVDHLRDGRAELALDLYEAHRRVSLRGSLPDAREQLVDDWWAGRENGSSLMIASTRVQATALNRLARERMRTAGCLTGADVTVRDQAFAVGDTVVVRRNDIRLGVHNGDVGRITKIGRDGLQVELQLERDGRLVSPGFGYLRRRTENGEPVLQHGYAVTGHIAQGMTVDRGYVLAAPGLSQEWAYTAMTRGRHENRLYAGADTRGREEFAPTASDDVRAELIRGLSTSHAQPLALEVQRGRGLGHEL
jgi:ATP-dependent exoDNAse (exonuclease V) alpha subunit